MYSGASGSSCNGWMGGFYSAGIPRREGLTCYVSGFNACELKACKIGYDCFNGCNGTGLWQNKRSYDRCDYSYSPQKVSEWVPKLQNLDSIAEEPLDLDNDHWPGQAVSTICQLKLMLD